jgi:AbiV family abortive infection protein
VTGILERGFCLVTHNNLQRSPRDRKRVWLLCRGVSLRLQGLSSHSIYRMSNPAPRRRLLPRAMLSLHRLSINLIDIAEASRVSFDIPKRQKRLAQYTGRLSPARIADGMNLAIRNARRLVADARLLLTSGSPSSAAALAALSIEESGKVAILRGLSLARTDREVKSQWKDYRSHVRKNAHWIFPSLVIGGARQLEDFRSMFDRDADHPQILDQLKQLTVYTDCLGSGRWSEPAQVIDRAGAEPLVAVAELMSQSPKQEVTAREIELWMQHMGPAWGGPMDGMKRAFRDWNEAMRRERLIEHNSSELDDFLSED